MKNYVYRLILFKILLVIKENKLNQSLFYMNAISELKNNRRKLVKDVACLAAEGGLLQRTAPL